ncbi:hypothetical protein [Rossellomorea sp. LjRoot5]|uniref:hypothetical protein n=1 Tax=Rossellomorea sp. LjRoot5 TaxID=3342331 RepID=UPI003ECE1A2F
MKTEILNREELVNRLREMIIRRLGLEIESSELSEEELLFDPEGVGLDSIDAFDIALGLELEFDYKLEEEQYSTSLESLKKITDLLLSREEVNVNNDV